MEIREQDQYDTLNGWRVVDAAAITQFVSLAIWPFTSSLVVLCIFIILNGIGRGSFFSLVSPILGQVFRPQNVVRNGSGTIYWNLDIAVFPQMPRAPYLSRLFNIFQEGKDIQREQNAVGWRMSTYSYDI
ncbi:hypothetical protein QL093DRAFT_2101846 [Fusarium oxysporum]|nr:hypothetical protein QL093DRAFT_2101846 [Fusarium oxysporum]